MQRSPFCVLSLAVRTAEGSPHSYEVSRVSIVTCLLIWRDNYAALSRFGLFLTGRPRRRGHRMRRRELMLLLGGAMTAARPLRAQQKAVPVMGILGLTSPAPC